VKRRKYIQRTEEGMSEMKMRFSQREMRKEDLQMGIRGKKDSDLVLLPIIWLKKTVLSHTVEDPSRSRICIRF